MWVLKLKYRHYSLCRQYVVFSVVQQLKHDGFETNEFLLFVGIMFNVLVIMGCQIELRVASHVTAAN